MSASTMEREVERLVALAAELVDRALARGIDVAEARVRSGSELSVQVRLGETELVEEAGHRSAGMRVMKDGRVALTSTSDLTESGLAPAIAERARKALCKLFLEHHGFAIEKQSPRAIRERIHQIPW